MDEQMSVQWEPRDGPPRKLRFEPADQGWHLITEVWDGREWHETDFEPVDDPSVYAPEHATATEQTPPTLRALLYRPRRTWLGTDPQALVFDRPADPIVVAAVQTSLRYYSAQLATCQPITEDGVCTLIRTFGLPEVRELSTTPYSKADFSRGDFDELR